MGAIAAGVAAKAVDKGMDIIGNAEIANTKENKSYVKGNNLEAEGDINVTDSHKTVDIQDKSKQINTTAPSGRYASAINMAVAKPSLPENTAGYER